MAEVISEELFRTLSVENPKLVVKYLAHLADQVEGDNNYHSAKRQIIDARVSHDSFGLEKATDRDRDLVDKLRGVASIFFDEQFILAHHASDGQARAIGDVLYRVREN